MILPQFLGNRVRQENAKNKHGNIHGRHDVMQLYFLNQTCCPQSKLLPQLPCWLKIMSASRTDKWLVTDWLQQNINPPKQKSANEQEVTLNDAVKQRGSSVRLSGYISVHHDFDGEVINKWFTVSHVSRNRNQLSLDWLKQILKDSINDWQRPFWNMFVLWMIHRYHPYCMFLPPPLLGLFWLMEKVETKEGAVKGFGSFFLLPSVTYSCLSSIWIHLFTHSSRSSCLMTGNAHQWLPAYYSVWIVITAYTWERERKDTEWNSLSVAMEPIKPVTLNIETNLILTQ